LPGEKTEKASLKKRQDERKKGNVFQSQDLVSASVLLSVFAILKANGSQFLTALSNGTAQIYTHLGDILAGPKDFAVVMSIAQNTLFAILTPILLVSMMAAIGVTFAQTRLLVTPSQLMPKFDRISPIQGFKKLFSVKSLVEAVKAMMKIAMIIVIIYYTVLPQMGQALRLFDESLQQSLVWVGNIVIDIGFRVSAALLILGVGDYFFQWWDYERKIKMTKHDVKEEFKQSEGNPEIKSRIRSLQRRLAKMRMMAAVPQADVVIRNPTHFAVALKYDEKVGIAPIVVAKGQDAVALRIVEIAEKNKVYITENRPLAQALFKSVDIGNQIPAEFYKAVAEVLAYIYRMKQSGRK
jgi:flagellar biosynthetic protein FlhB